MTFIIFSGNPYNSQIVLLKLKGESSKNPCQHSPGGNIRQDKRMAISCQLGAKKSAISAVGVDGLKFRHLLYSTGKSFFYGEFIIFLEIGWESIFNTWKTFSLRNFRIIWKAKPIVSRGFSLQSWWFQTAPTLLDFLPLG